MVNNAVIWFEICARDILRAKAFYESVFQVKLEKMDGEGPAMWSFPTAMNVPGVGGMLVERPGAGAGGTLVYFSCEDCAVEAARVVRHGGRLEQEKAPIGKYGFFALAVDTEGNPIGLHSMK